MDRNITSIGLLIALYYLNLSLSYAVEQNGREVEGEDTPVSIEAFRFETQEDLDEYIQAMKEQK